MRSIQPLLHLLTSQKDVVDVNGAIDYLEFITTTMHMNRMEREDRVYKAFEYFDKDKSGYITMEESEHALKEYNITDEKTIKEIIIKVDTDNVWYPFPYASLYDISIYNT